MTCVLSYSFQESSFDFQIIAVMESLMIKSNVGAEQQRNYRGKRKLA